MKKTGILGIIALLWTTCSTDFVVEAEWRDIPIVHGFLSIQDTAHYIRVEKAYLEPGGDALRIAKTADSLYYDDKVQVQLQRISNGQLFTLQKVDGVLEGYPREEGIFATAPNFLYKIRASSINLRPGERIRLRINRSEDKAPVTSETVILGDIEPREINPPSPLNLAYDRIVNFAWDADQGAQLFDLRLLIFYRESVPGSPGVFVNKSVTWVIADNILRDNNAQTNRVSINIRGEEFYRFMQSKLDPVSDRIRILDRIDMQVTGVGKELVDLLRISRANAGITSSQAVPVYSNLSEGRGIFSSRSSATRLALTLNPASADSLRSGIYTRNLNFQ